MVVAKTFEYFTVDINAETGFANLRTLEFQGATKTNKPRFDEGTLIFCRVLKVDKFSKTELTCIHPSDKKSFNTGEAIFRDLKGGLVRDFPIGFCRSLLSSSNKEPGQVLLEKLGTKFHFEINIGYNGKIWVNSERSAAEVIFIFNALERLVELTQGGGADSEQAIEFIMKTLPSTSNPAKKSK